MFIRALLLSMVGILPLCAGLKFEEEKISTDVGLDEKTISRDFKFVNAGDKVVTIKGADAGCSCISVEIGGGKFTYAPGEKGTIRANFEIGSFQGTVDKSIHVWLDGDPDEKPSSTVMLSINIPIIIALEPKTVKWKLGEGGSPKMIDVKMDYEKPIHIMQVVSSNENFQIKLITLEQGKHYQVEVTPQDSEATGLGILRIETDVDVPKQRIQQAFAVISAPFEKEP